MPAGMMECWSSGEKHGVMEDWRIGLEKFIFPFHNTPLFQYSSLID
jgi:hypothetical protein